MKNKVLKILILLLAVIPVFLLPLFPMDRTLFLIFSIVLIALTILTFLKQKALFSTILFFTLVHITRPINTAFCELLHFNFPGTFFLIPILIFTALIIILPGIRGSVGWWTRETIDKKSMLLIPGLAIISGPGLYIWGVFIADDLSQFTDMLPEVPVTWILINGIGFALFNAIAEEYLARGMLWNGLEKIFSDKWSVILIQSLVFSIFHLHGFPGGIIGMTMVFAWSVVLGIIRYRTKGLIAVILSHFMADMTIYFILYGIK